MKYRIAPLAERYIAGFHAAFDSVAREREHLAHLKAPPLRDTRKFLHNTLRKGNPNFVALVKGKVVGWCDITRMEADVFSHSGVLGMGIIDGYRGMGIGKALMLAALARARKVGLTRVELTVRPANKRAMKLYKEMGFVMEGVKRRGVRVDGKYEDLYCMGLLLE